MIGFLIAVLFIAIFVSVQGIVFLIKGTTPAAEAKIEMEQIKKSSIITRFVLEKQLSLKKMGAGVLLKDQMTVSQWYLYKILMAGLFGLICGFITGGVIQTEFAKPLTVLVVIMRDMLVDERNLPLNVIRNLKLVNDAVIKIAKEEEIELDAVSALMVYEELTEKSISYKMVIALMDIYHGTISIDEMEDSDDRLQDNTKSVESKIELEMDKDTKDALDKVFGGFSKLELYIFMKEFGFLGNELRSMTVKELSYQDYFVSMAKDDIDGEKNIEFGDVHIKRPGRNSGREEEILVESVYFVKEKFYSNKVAKIKKRLATLSGVISMNDVLGCLEAYCIELWKDKD